MTVAQDKTGVGAGSMEWQTPPDLFAWLNARFQFNYDAFASDKNALLPFYSTEEGTFERPESWVSIHDGLNYSWHGRRVFMNPPYSRDLIAKCVRKAVDERNNAQIIVALIPASTETMWFQQLIFPYCHIEWLPKRVRFIDPETGQPGQSPPSGSVVAIFKQDWQ